MNQNKKKFIFFKLFVILTHQNDPKHIKNLIFTTAFPNTHLKLIKSGRWMVGVLDF